MAMASLPLKNLKPNVANKAFQLLDRQDCLRHLLRETPDNIYFKDLSGRFLLISHAMAEYFKLDHPEQAYGKTDFDFFSEEHAQQALEDERTIIETGRPISKEEKETWPDGRETWVSTSKDPLIDDTGCIVGTFGISRDITDRKVAEARAAQYAAELERMNASLLSDLTLAGELQAALLPVDYPAFPACAPAGDSALRFAHRYVPSQVVGGDFFSVIRISECEASIFFCDGMGHDVRAALLASMLSSLFREQARTFSDPAACLTRLDRELHALLKDHADVWFATALCMSIDAVTGVCRYANAGHLAPLVARSESGRVEPLFSEHAKSGPALGLVRNAVFATHEGQLQDGDRMLLFTDGLVERVNPQAHEFGADGVSRALGRVADLALDDGVEEILQAARKFGRVDGFEDDVCMLCIEKQPPPQNE